MSDDFPRTEYDAWNLGQDSPWTGFYALNLRREIVRYFRHSKGAGAKGANTFIKNPKNLVQNHLFIYNIIILLYINNIILLIYPFQLNFAFAPFAPASTPFHRHAHFLIRTPFLTPVRSAPIQSKIGFCTFAHFEN